MSFENSILVRLDAKLGAGAQSETSGARQAKLELNTGVRTCQTGSVSRIETRR